MKKIVLIFGLISGALMAIFMFATMPFIDKIGFDKGLIVGYTNIVLAFILVFFGIRSYRENVNSGAVTFGRAFMIGILITLISSVCYVIAWQILFHNFMPDFFDKYAAHVIEKARASGATPEAIQAQTQQLEKDMALLKNPFFPQPVRFSRTVSRRAGHHVDLVADSEEEKTGTRRAYSGGAVARPLGTQKRQRRAMQ